MVGIVSPSSLCEGEVSCQAAFDWWGSRETGEEQGAMRGRWMLTGVLGAGHGLIKVPAANLTAN